MPATDLPEFWHITYPVPDRNGAGTVNYWQDAAESRDEAHIRAASLSRRYGHATITSRAGLVATYVQGQQTT